MVETKRTRLVCGLVESYNLARLSIHSLSDMRKPLSRDSARRSVRSNGRDIVVSAHDVS